MSKRAAFSIAADKIVSTIQAKDCNGASLYPDIDSNPELQVFLSTPEALLEVMLTGPVTILSLIQSSKTLNKVWNNIPGIWPLLLDNLLAIEEEDFSDEEQDQETHLSKVYPFFIVTQRNVEDWARPILDYEGSNPLRPESMSATLPDFKEPVRPLGENHMRERYALVYYDDVTKLYMELLQTLWLFERRWLISPPFQLGIAVAEYTNTQIDRSSLLTLFIMADYVVPLTDAFLISSHTKIVYRPLAMRDKVKKVITWLQEYIFIAKNLGIDRERFFKVFENEIAKSAPDVLLLLTDTLDLAQSLQNLITGPECFEIVADTPVALTRDFARPYRDILFNKERGLYKTPEEQQKLFVDILSAIYYGRYEDETEASKRTFITKYSEKTSLACSRCGKETEHVDPVTLQSFCGEKCRSL